MKLFQSVNKLDGLAQKTSNYSLIFKTNSEYTGRFKKGLLHKTAPLPRLANTGFINPRGGPNSRYH